LFFFLKKKLLITLCNATTRSHYLVIYFIEVKNMFFFLILFQTLENLQNK